MSVSHLGHLVLIASLGCTSAVGCGAGLMRDPAGDASRHHDAGEAPTGDDGAQDGVSVDSSDDGTVPPPERQLVPIGGYMAAVWTSPADIGNAIPLFDGRTETLLRSAAVNPAIIDIELPVALVIDRIRVHLGEVGYAADVSAWKVESADSRADLDARTGSYRQAVAIRSGVVGRWDAADLATPVQSRLWRFTIWRTLGDDYVHINEIELWEQSLGPLQGYRDTYQVLVLNYDPVSGPAHGGQRLSQLFSNWPDQNTALSTYVSDVARVSGGSMSISVVGRFDLDELPPVVPSDVKAPDGRTLVASNRWVDPDTFVDNLERMAAGDIGCDGPCWVDLADSGGVAYDQIISDPRFGIAEAVARDELDAVVILAPPLSGVWEAVLAGTGAYGLGVPPVATQQLGRMLVVLGARRDDGEAGLLAATAHAIQSIVENPWSRAVAPSWPRRWLWQGELYNDWQRFSFTIAESGAQSGPVTMPAQVGTPDRPPNARAILDWTNEVAVVSAAEDWRGYPALNGITTNVSCATWARADGNYRAGYLLWWLEHLPHNPGAQPGGVLNNWWRYLTNVNRF